MSLDASEENTVRFVNWISEHGRSYNTVEEFNMRQKNWNRKDKFIKEFYEQNEGLTFDVGHNQFSDWTEAEFKRMLGTGRRLGASNSTKVPNPPQRLLPSMIPVSWDWRHQRKVTAVKNQYHCGGCWAFATIATLESNHAIKTGGQLLTFSEQSIISCVNETYECHQCEGGEVWGAYQFWIDNNWNLIRERSWRYQGQNETCKYNSTGQTSYQINQYYSVPMNDSDQLR